VRVVLTPAEWLPRRDRHRNRVTALLGGYLRQRGEGRSNPVIDFLFTYYNVTAGQLRRWHPGFGVTLTGPESHHYAKLRGYGQTDSGVAVRPDHLTQRRGTVEYVGRLMAATASRPANLDCFGMHEWAMVYKADPEELRHGVPLRLGRDGTDEVVESIPLRCSHFDAFRFFTPDAAPRNVGSPSRATQQDWEQPGCLHANMDLYKWSYKLSPLIDSETLLDCLELAAAAREIDMRASPYDLSGYGYPPIAVEDAAGRAEYVRCQKAIATRAEPLRAALLARCDLLLQAAGCR
jgi:hypothetical protein